MEDFIEKVKEMRLAQRYYFNSGHGTSEKGKWLKESKRLEREVDKMLKEGNLNQKQLF